MQHLRIRLSAKPGNPFCHTLAFPHQNHTDGWSTPPESVPAPGRTCCRSYPEPAGSCRRMDLCWPCRRLPKRGVWTGGRNMDGCGLKWWERQWQRRWKGEMQESKETVREKSQTWSLGKARRVWWSAAGALTGVVLPSPVHSSRHQCIQYILDNIPSTYCFHVRFHQGTGARTIWKKSMSYTHTDIISVQKLRTCRLKRV